MPEDAHPHRLSFLFISVLATACLVLLCVDLAKTNMRSLASSDPVTPADYLRSFSKSAHVAELKFGHVTGSTKGIAKKGPFAVAASFAGATANGVGALGSKALGGVAAVGRGVVAGASDTAHAVSRVPHYAAAAVNVNTYIKTADYVHVPVITPAPDTPAPKPLATVSVPAPAQPVQPASQAPAPAPARPAVTVQPIIAKPPLQFNTLNTYARGNCTWWAANRRAEVGDPIPDSWGNAATWASRAVRDGFAVDHHPSPDAIMQTPYSAGGLGHVAFVESVDADGTWHISEMNVLGLGVVDHKALHPSAAVSYNFIHDRI